MRVQFLIHAVPNAPPTNLNATVVSSRFVYLTWNPPAPEAQNGVITGYFIDVTVQSRGEMFQLFSDINSLEMDTLIPFTTYICIIAAQTVVGIGPYSTNYAVTTLEDGKNIHN